MSVNYTDLVNGIFEFIGAIFVIMHIVTLMKDKKVKGLYIPSTVYFLSWGLWNVYFYPVNGLWFSFVGGVSLALANLVWVGLLIYYSRK